MNLLPKSREEFGQKEYWNNFFKKRGTKAFEWYGEYPELCGLLHKYIKPKDELLMIGCGNSTLSADMYDVGYRNMTNIDISSVVIRQMQESHGRDRPGMIYEKMDALHTTYNDGQFSVVLDKGTLDALMPDDSQEVQQRIEQLFQEIDRLLRIGGRYVCVSLLQEHILVKLLVHFSTAGWMVRVSRCLEAEHKAVEESSDKFALPVFVVVCTKFKKMPNMTPVLEVSTDGNQLQRLGSPTEVLDCVKAMQQSAMVCSRLGRGSVADLGEVSIDLHRPGEENLRYSIHVLDRTRNNVRSANKYATFIVPQGRETEWLFGTPEGRNVLLQSAGFDRLAIVSLHRGQTYESLDAIQLELSSSVQSLAPFGLPTGYKIPYLSVGSDVGRREVVHTGNSSMSGDYVVEDVEGDGGAMSRRLIFLNNKDCIQSEARLKTVKGRKGKAKQVLDVGYLACEHHSYMSVGPALADSAPNHNQVLLIGLGGGGLCTFLQHCFNKIQLTAVDIDPAMLEIATKFFGLVQDERLQVHIQDGLQYLQQEYEKGAKYGAILFDVDNKDQTVGMTCPPIAFLQPSVLETVKQLLHQTGVFVLNLISRSSVIRTDVLTRLSLVFPHVCSYKLETDVNEVIFCSEQPLQRDDIERGVAHVNKTAREKKIKTDDVIDLDLFMSLLVIDK